MALVIGYIRVSTEEQHLGPEAQRAAIEQWCQREKHTLEQVCTDIGISGGAPLEDRPGLLGAVGAVRAKHAKYLVVAKRDRLARDVIVAAMVERLIEREGARIASADGAGNGEGPESQLLRGIIDVFAQYERAIIRARTRAALAIKRKRQEAYCRVPFGFVRVGNMFVPDPDQEEALAEMRKLRAQGLSYEKIAEILNRVEAKTARGGWWHAQTIRRILLAAA